MNDESESTNLREQEIVTQDSIEEKKLRFEREKEKWHILSNILTVLITVGIGTYGVTHINNVYQERQLKREQIFKEKEVELLEKKAVVERQKVEMQYLGQFLKHALVEDVDSRLRFAEYFANLTTTPELKQGWLSYLAVILKDKKELEEKNSNLLTTTNQQETEQLIKDIVKLKSKLDALLPWKKIGHGTVFKIQCASSTGRSEETTGFRLEGLTGIITALHGVVKCRGIRVFSGDGEIYFEDLRLIKADILHDVALLSSTEVKHFALSGLPASGLQPNHEGLYIIGYPFGMLSSLISSQINILIPPVTELWTLLPARVRAIIKKRNSPDININVLTLEATVLPGHSGAPLLNEHNQVIGIINGGLEAGKVGISWAIPLKDIQFQPVDAIRDELFRLSNFPSFSDKSVPDPPKAEKENTKKEDNNAEALF